MSRVQDRARRKGQAAVIDCDSTSQLPTPNSKGPHPAAGPAPAASQTWGRARGAGRAGRAAPLALQVVGRGEMRASKLGTAPHCWQQLQRCACLHATPAPRGGCHATDPTGLATPGPGSPAGARAAAPAPAQQGRSGSVSSIRVDGHHAHQHVWLGGRPGPGWSGLHATCTRLHDLALRVIHDPGGVELVNKGRLLPQDGHGSPAGKAAGRGMVAGVNSKAGSGKACGKAALEKCLGPALRNLQGRGGADL